MVPLICLKASAMLLSLGDVVDSEDDKNMRRRECRNDLEGWGESDDDKTMKLRETRGGLEAGGESDKDRATGVCLVPNS